MPEDLTLDEEERARRLTKLIGEWAQAYTSDPDERRAFLDGVSAVLENINEVFRLTIQADASPPRPEPPG